jgi:hypothetical protein
MAEHTGAIQHIFNGKNLGTFKSSGVATFESGVIQSNNFATVSTATATLTSSQSGSIISVTKADGVTITLPTCAPGLRYKIVQTIANSGGSTKILTASASEFLLGAVMINDNDGTPGVFASFAANGSTHRSISFNGTTTGGAIGANYIELVGISTTQWYITGVGIGTGTVATPFATS